jgi:hypothetical protein
MNFAESTKTESKTSKRLFLIEEEEKTPENRVKITFL